ncbi:MAG: hypothetical protein ABR567_10720 [Myxococcales bacterium]|nr:hypothetical protein [Myxococcales bacterium]
MTKADQTQQAIVAMAVRSVAERAECDRRSVRRFLAGDPVRSLTERRIRRAISSCGLESLLLKERAS